MNLTWDGKSGHWLLTAYTRDTSASKSFPAVLDEVFGPTQLPRNNAGDLIVGFEDIDVNTATLDSAMDAGMGIMARLKLVGEVFPTPVGMNRVILAARRMGRSVPHARGDEPRIESISYIVSACSPRPWG